MSAFIGQCGKVEIVNPDLHTGETTRSDAVTSHLPHIQMHRNTMLRKAAHAHLFDMMTAFGSTIFGYSGPSQNQRVQVNNTNYVYSGLGCDCESNSAGSTYYTHDNRGQLLDERTASGTCYYLFDGLGSVVGLTTSTGTLVSNETYQYDPYGQLSINPGRQLQTNAWRYASGYYDMSTG